MPQNITDVDTWSTPLTCEADGDAVNGTNRLTHEQKIGNRTELLRKRTYGANDADLIWVPMTPMAQDPAGVRFAVGVSGNWCLNQIAATAAHICYLDLMATLPKNGVMTDMSLNLRGATGAPRGNPPATTMPRLRLMSKDPGANSAAVQVATVTDATATGAAYEALHTISLTGLSVPLTNDGGLIYFVELRGETGGNALAGLEFHSLTYYVDPS